MYFIAFFGFILKTIGVDSIVAHSSMSRFELPLAPYNIQVDKLAFK
jgi:hypothetical protein